jgi:hypothetical protein
VTRVSHFQRHSQRENHATNNTLLILRHFYQHSPFKLQNVLRDLLEDANLSIGLEFDLQIKGESSIPDALISQDPMRIYFETKLWDALDADQIRRHIETISKAGEGHTENPILIGLTKIPLKGSDKERFSILAKEKGVVFSAVTFTQIVEILRKYCADYEDELISVLDDYRDFLQEEGLLGMYDGWMIVFPCGTSRNENVKFGLYYEPAGRPYKRGYGFFGIYHDKMISHVGLIEAVVYVSFSQGEISFEAADGKLTEAHRNRITQAINETHYYNLKAQKLRFYMVDEFHTTEMRKTSPYGIMGTKAFGLSKLIDNFDVHHRYSGKEVAVALQGKEWQ